MNTTTSPTDRIEDLEKALEMEIDISTKYKNFAKKLLEEKAELMDIVSSLHREIDNLKVTCEYCKKAQNED